MSILIKGMEMPDRCGHCRFATAFDCEVDRQFIPTHDARRKDCPLVPVPPHGRLIDADAIEHDGWIVSRTYQSHTANVYEVKHVNAFPTIIEAEEGK